MRHRASFLPIVLIACAVIAPRPVRAMSGEDLGRLCADETPYATGLCDGILVGVLQGAVRGMRVAAVARPARSPIAVCIPSVLSQTEIVTAVRQAIIRPGATRESQDGADLVLSTYQRLFPCHSR